MAKSTAGPWRVPACSPSTVRNGNGDRVAHVNNLLHEWPANARLIAAAPALLGACEEALRYLEHRLLGNVSYPAEILRAAIAKATGEEDDNDRR